MSTSAPGRSRHSHQRASWPGRARIVARFPAALLLGYAVAVLAGWAFGVEVLVTGGPGHTITAAPTAVAVGFLAAGVLFAPGSVARRGCYTVPLLLGTAFFAQHAFGLDLGIDELLFEDVYSPSTAHPGRPSQGTALALVTLSLAGLLTEHRRRTLAQLLAGAGLLIAQVAVFGYLYGVNDLYEAGQTRTMSAATAVALLLAALTIWLTVSQGILQWIVFGTDSGARAQRGLVPVAFLLIPAAAWWFVQSVETDVVDLALGTALMTSFTALVIVAVNYRTGRTALRMDRERDALLEELHRVNAELEDRVRTKVHQLNRQRTKLALFEERDRIARDLHDRVIQRIFAAGLQVASVSRAARKEAAARGGESPVPESLDLIARELDLAIRELRNSIFELTSIGDLDNVEQVVRDIASRASRILGFMPRIEVTGQVAGISADLVAQLASVIQEGLSNIARHAHASAAQVAVHGTDDILEVRVTDDGVGLPDPLPRSSGISNLIGRAHQLGGTATWRNGDPTGTVLTWRVPRSSSVDRLDAPVQGAVTRARDGSGAGQGSETPVARSDIDHSAAAASGS